MEKFLFKTGLRRKNSPQSGKWTAPVIGGAFVLILAGLLTACPNPTGSSSPSKSGTPAVANDAAASVAKTSAPQQSVSFTLTSTHDGAWKVYDAETGGSPRTDITVTFAAPAKTLTLAHATDIPAVTYWVTVTQSGRTESGRLKLTVGAFTPEGQTEPPTADITSVAKTAASQQSVAFTLTSSHTGTWKVYDAATDGSTPAGITASFNTSTKILTLTHATDVEARTYWVTVTETGKTESPRLKLTVRAFTPEGQTEPPTAEVTSVAKPAASQASIAFTLTSSHTGAWKVYDAETGGSPRTDINAAFAAPTLTLTHTSDIPAGNYWVTVTGTGKAESARLHLTVEAFTAPVPSSPPTAEAANTSVAKTAASQQSVAFTLTSSHTGTWQVYDAAADGSTPAGITVTFDAPTKTLTLTHTSDIPAGDYWVAVTETGKTESTRLKLTVTAPVSAPAGASITSITQAGGTSALTDTASIKIVFDRALDVDLAVSNITLAFSEGTLGTLTKESGTDYTLALTAVVKEGDITLTFSHSDVADTSKTVRVFKDVDHTATHGTATAAGLYAGDMAVPVSDLGNSDDGTELLNTAFDWIKTNAKASGNYRIVLGADAEQAAKTLASADFHSVTGVTITLAGDTEERTIQLSSATGSLYTINSANNKLRLDNYITLKGVTANTVPLITITAGGLVMENGSMIADNTVPNTAYVASAVKANSTFLMNGGTIQNCKNTNQTSPNNSSQGAAVIVDTGAVFTMGGGFIKNNQGGFGGGVNVSGRGQFIMQGTAEISGNTNQNKGGGVRVSDTGTFTMSGSAVIKNNTSRWEGGGVVLDDSGTFNMEGGVISGNTAGGTNWGGGVCGNKPTVTFIKTGGIIYGSNADTALANKQATASTDKGAAVLMRNNSPQTLLGKLENTVAEQHNVEKLAGDTTAAQLTQAKGWTE